MITMILIRAVLVIQLEQQKYSFGHRHITCKFQLQILLELGKEKEAGSIFLFLAPETDMTAMELS